MTYADPMRRCDLIAGLRALANLLADTPQVPAPCNVNVLVFPADVGGHDGRAEIDRIAGLLGVNVDDETVEYGHYVASRVFGPVEYRAIFIPARTRAHHDARNSYSGNVIPSTREET